jgi:hypothetical protein
MGEQENIPRGSYLIIENLNRLTREHIRPALTLLLNLIERGIRVVQLIPVEQVITEDVEIFQLMLAIMELSRGNSESRIKSERMTARGQQSQTIGIPRASRGVPLRQRTIDENVRLRRSCV